MTRERQTLTLDIVPNDQEDTDHPVLLFLEQSVQLEDRDEVDELLRAMDADVVVNVYEGVLLNMLPRFLSAEEIRSATFLAGSFWSTFEMTRADIYPSV